MPRLLYPLVSVVAYAIFFATFVYLVAFVGGLPDLAVSVDRGPQSAPAVALIFDLMLIAIFGIQHSVMARPAFKARWTMVVPPALERSVYVLAASACLLLLFAAWRPIAGDLWRVTGPGAVVIWTLGAAGWAIVLLSTFLINHFELFGLMQAYRAWRGRSAADPRFRTPLFYRMVRHPLYSGFLIAFWATPVMTVGHAVLAAGMSVYVLVAIRYEERDLLDLFGADYAAYQADTGMLIPGVGKRG